MAWAIEDEQKILTQGSIVDGVDWSSDESDDTPIGIVLSNPCDLEHDKASYILIAALIPALETIQQSKEFIDKAGTSHQLSKSKSETLTKLLSAYIHNVNITRYFFIDPTKAFEGPLLLVDFQRVICVPIKEKANLEIIGKLGSPFKEKMIMHYASYVSRIGVDRINEEDTLDICKKLAQPFVI